jgi:hypothetical protein
LSAEGTSLCGLNSAETTFEKPALKGSALFFNYKKFFAAFCVKKAFSQVKSICKKGDKVK